MVSGRAEADLRPPLFIPIEILRGATAALGLGRPEVAKDSGLSQSTVRRAFESPAKASQGTLLAVRKALEIRGVQFHQSGVDGGPGLAFASGMHDARRRVFKGARIALGTSQLQLSEWSGVAPRTMVRIERGEAVRIASVTDVTDALARRGLTMLRDADGAFAGFRIGLDRLSRHDLRF